MALTCYKRIPIFYKNKVHFVDTLSRRTYFWDTAVPCGSEKSHNVVQLNPDEDKCYLLTPYPTLMHPLKKCSPENIRAIARNPNIDLQSIGIYSKFDIQHHIRTQQFQELLTQMDIIQRQSIDKNLRKLAETAGFADIYTQDYSGFFKEPSIAQIPTQPTSKTPSQLFHFSLSRQPIPQLLIYHQARIQTLTQIIQFFILSHSLTTPTSKLPTNSPTPNHLTLPIPRPIPQFFHKPPFNLSKPVNHSHPFQLLPLMLPK